MKLTRSFVSTFVWVTAVIAQPANDVRLWRDSDVSSFRLPLAGWGKAPGLLTEKQYYALPEVNLKTYPVYTPDKEPAGYLDWLRQQEPQPLVDYSKLKTDADWIAAGREIFYGRELPRFTGSEHNLAMIRNPQVLAAYRLNTTAEGVLVGLRYVVREKGKVELGTDTCAMCHVQIRNGRLIEGPPNTHTPFGPLMGDLTRRYQQMSPQMLEERRRKHMREDYRVPFLANDPNLKIADLPAEEIATLYDAHPLGVHGRTNTSLQYPVKISNLIGVTDLKYLDHTGTARNRGLTDLARYSGMIGDVTDSLTRYADGPEGKLLLEHMGLGGGVKRSPDAAWYAVARFLASLKPPANPNPFDDQARRGQQVFARAGCQGCHPAPLYTNNKLTLAQGFTAPKADLTRYDIMPLSVGTDPNLALKTRKGTGYYRVPSLRLVWMDSAFLHDGAIGSLEALFNPERLKPGFRSSNWHPKTPAHAVEGHRFGLDLPPADRAALISFLKTL